MKRTIKILRWTIPAPVAIGIALLVCGVALALGLWLRVESSPFLVKQVGISLLKYGPGWPPSVPPIEVPDFWYDVRGPSGDCQVVEVPTSSDYDLDIYFQLYAPGASTVSDLYTLWGGLLDGDWQAWLGYGVATQYEGDMANLFPGMNGPSVMPLLGTVPIGSISEDVCMNLKTVYQGANRANTDLQLLFAAVPSGDPAPIPCQNYFQKWPDCSP